MSKLAPCLDRLFDEIDFRWPHRDRRTDGWYANPKVRKSIGHNPGDDGWTHAIDVDKDGIAPDWLIDHITKAKGVLFYIIWNRKLYSATYNWDPQPYKGENPHTDHLHIEIRQTAAARNWTGSWGIKTAGLSSIGAAPGIETQWGSADYLAETNLTGNTFKGIGDALYGLGGALADLRNR